ncbi:Retrotransposon-derived protein peg10 [Entomophthora muscae]|uniref:Retrotransposon-derived protein peg10 n=1 Tax=Entomophthora muscae TaxID=34485 RepID=A0ACC2RK31_9FUNG|nr:Retrotransposon-derived protein peg10 [Entomophthora muscae]
MYQFANGEFLNSITPFVSQYKFLADHFTAYRSEFSTSSQKVHYLVEKLTSHYRDWFSSHLIHNPGILQNYDLFVSSLLSFSGEEEESFTPSASWFLGLTQGPLSLGKYNRKLKASNVKACSFYKIGLNKSLQEFLVHHNLPNELEPLIREVVKWNQRYLSSKTHPSSNLSPEAQLSIPDKVLLSSTPSHSTKPKAGGGFCLTAKKVLRRRNNKICSYCGSKDHLLPACPLSNNTSKSPTILITIHGPLGKIKVLDLLDTGTNANLIEEKLAILIGLPTFRSLDIKVGNSIFTGATPIL